MKKVLTAFLIVFMITNASYASIYPTLPANIGSNSEIIKILLPEENKVTSNSEEYLISCMAEPGTEITLYERYDDTLFIPIMINNEAITGKVGESGLYLIDMSFKANSTNRIMFFAQNGKRYQSEFRTIVVEEKEKEKKDIEYTILNIQDFVESVQNSVK